MRKETSWQFGDAQRQSFNALKNAITSAPVLHIIDCSDDGGGLELHTDASDVALSGVLFQWVGTERKPCAFYSRTLTAAEQHYSATNRELLAIVASLKHYRHYV
jgi:RNase H-like domain found in reverse transcriptase